MKKKRVEEKVRRSSTFRKTDKKSLEKIKNERIGNPRLRECIERFTRIARNGKCSDVAFNSSPVLFYTGLYQSRVRASGEKRCANNRILDNVSCKFTFYFSYTGRERFDLSMITRVKRVETISLTNVTTTKKNGWGGENMMTQMSLRSADYANNLRYLRPKASAESK